MGSKFFNLKRSHPVSAFILFFLLLIVLHPWREKRLRIPSIGDVSREEVIAPITFYILKSDAEFEKEKKEISASVPEILVKNDSISALYLDSLKRSFEKTKEVRQKRVGTEEKRKLLKDIWGELSNEELELLQTTRHLDSLASELQQTLASLYDEGICPNNLAEEAVSNIYAIRTQDGEHIYPAESVLHLSGAKKELESLLGERFGSYPELHNLANRIGEKFLTPNLVWDKATTEQQRALTLKTLTRHKGVVLKNERIVGAHERITPEIYEKLTSLVYAMRKSSSTFQKTEILQKAATVFLYALVVLMLALFSTCSRPNMWQDQLKLLLFLSLLLFEILFIRATEYFDIPFFLVPLSFATMCVYLIFNATIATTFIIALGIIAGLNLSFSFSYAVYIFISGFISLYIFSGLKTRNEAYKLALVNAVLSAIVALAISGARFKSTSALTFDASSAFFSSFASPLLAISILPALEHFTGKTTNFTLLEYANTNNILLQQMAIEAPGTYSHSVLVATLAEACAESVSANPLLAKAGGYYHDIGKLTHPDYFDENTRGKTKHDKLSPHMSFLVLSSHIPDGVELAKKHRLPQPIIDIIKEHHGTTLMEYFYRKAIEKGENASEDEFRYPGPRPQTKESAIVMLADELEACIRSIDSPTPEIIKDTIDDIVKRRVDEGELDESPLTLNEIKIIKEKFFNIFTGLYHTRTPYPAEKGADENDSYDETIY